MTKTASLANGEAMPSLNRRRLLLGLAAASTAAAVVGIQTGPAEGFANLAKAPDENPALLDLGNRTAALMAELVKAQEAESHALQAGNRLWPLAPDELARSYNDSHSWERNLQGAALYRPGKERPMSVMTADEIALDIEDIGNSIRRKRKPETPLTYRGVSASIPEWVDHLASLRALHTTATKYEADRARVDAVCGYSAAKDVATVARERLTLHVAAVMECPAVTMAGVMVKAEALAAFAQVPRFWQVTESRSWGWAGNFAATILQIAGGEA